MTDDGSIGMRVGRCLAAVVVLGLVLGASARAATSVAAAAVPLGRPPATRLSIPANARVIVFAPHPDDETIAVGGLLARLAHRGTPVRVVFMTNGDGFPSAVRDGLDVPQPTDADFVALGRLRQREAVGAARKLGIARRDLRFLGFPDGGLEALWQAHWKQPYTSPYTKEASPPYADAVNPDAEYDGKDLLSVVLRELRDFHPTVVIMPHPHERHPDHLAASYFVTEAVSELVHGGVLVQPTVLTYMVHYPSWPASLPPHFDRVLTLSEVPETSWLETELTADEIEAKRAALSQYKSQLSVMNGFLRRFVCRNELFGRVEAGLLARIASVH